MADLYLIGNAHIDPAWLWRWQDGFSEVLATFRSALDRLAEFPELKFTAGSAVYYQWVEQTDPAMFAQIQQMVKAGRWSIVGGWVLQPDCNIPDGESYARHSLIGQRYFKEKFGVIAKTGYNVDPFGHNGAIPKVLKGSGMDNYVCMRPMPHESGFDETLFNWESDDGSAVCAFRLPFTYHIDLSCVETFGKIKEKAEAENMDYMAFYGVGNHGGGPTIALLDGMKKLGIDGMVHATVDEYFAKADKVNLPVVRGELQHNARGCYSANTFVKTANRQCEQNLLAAETLSVIASALTGAAYPQKEFGRAWENVLFNQFHDILCGCSIQQVYRDAGYLYGEAMGITERAINFAMQKIAWNIDTLNGESLPAYKLDDKSRGQWAMWVHEVLGTPIVVFNPHACAVTQPVRVYGAAQKMTDCADNEIPFQIVRGRHTNFGNKHDTVFTATVPPMGYAVYRMFTEQASKTVFANTLAVTETTLENNNIKVELSAQTGDICRIYDKETGAMLLDWPCKTVVLDETACNTWGHDVDALGEVVGTFGRPQFCVLEQGGVRASVRTTSHYNGAVLEKSFTITPDSKCVEVKVTLNFCEPHRTVKCTFPLAEETVVAKAPYGTVCRKGYTGEEPCGSWFASGGLCVANDSKYAYDTSDGEVRMTVLRTSLYADHYCERDDFGTHMDMGVHEFSYSVFPYTTSSAAEKTASALQFGLRVVVGSFHGGALPMKMSCFACDNEDVIVSAVKKGEDTNAPVIRLYEMNGHGGSLSFTLFDRKIDAQIGPHAIKTFRADGTELNLLEWEEEEC